MLFYRTQPDYSSLVSVMFPFHYRDASPYLESTPGDWSVVMATEHYTIEGAPLLTDTLYAVDPIAVPAGTARTVVFMDAPGGGYQSVVLTPDPAKSPSGLNGVAAGAGSSPPAARSQRARYRRSEH